MRKQNVYRFNLSFDEADEDHRRVCDYLNKCGRKKARYIVKAILAYWVLQEGDVIKSEHRKEVVSDLDSCSSQSRVINLDDDFKIDPTEAELMKQNYSIFEDME